MTEKKLAQKMAEAALEIGFGVEKDGRNQSQGYGFVSAANVKKVCGRAFARQGIAVSSTVEVLRSDAVPTKSGGQQDRHLVRVTVTFTDGVESLSTQGLGCGMDSGDKAPMKAFTAAEKYAYISAFSLALGEDPEWDEEPEERKATPNVRSQERPVDEAAFQGAMAGKKKPMEELREVSSAEGLRTWMETHVPRLAGLEPDVKRAAMAVMVEVGARFDMTDRDVRAWVDEVIAQGSR